MSKQLTEDELMRLPERYLAMWNEPDANMRRTLISELWAADGAQVLVDPPQAIREAASALAFPIPTLTVRGHEALDHRVTRAHEMFVAPGEYIFESRGAATRLSVNLVGFTWVMVAKPQGTVAGGGYEVLALDGEGRIRLDHQYIGLDD